MSIVLLPPAHRYIYPFFYRFLRFSILFSWLDFAPPPVRLLIGWCRVVKTKEWVSISRFFNAHVVVMATPPEGDIQLSESLVDWLTSSPVILGCQ